MAVVDFCPFEGEIEDSAASRLGEPMLVMKGMSSFLRAKELRIAAIAVCALVLSGGQTRALAGTAPVPPETVLAAIDDSLATVPGLDLFSPPEPRRLRPCCAFGGTMRVALLGVPLPLYRHKPVRDAAQIGPHEYDPGLLQILPSRIDDDLPHGEGDHEKREHNGIVYTCRAGFLDTAHVRDFADLAWFLAARVETRLETGGTIDLVDYGGTRRVTIHPVPAAKIAAIGGTRLAVAVAARLSFDLSVWREIATWYGYESVPPWPEKLSSFSPEDLVSNLLGTRLAAGILETRTIRSRHDWDLAMTEWLPSALEALGIVPGDTARDLMQSVDGSFWNSGKRIPDWRITMRRKFDRGPEVEPWTVATSEDVCARGQAPVRIPVRDELAGVEIDDVAEIHVVVSDRLVRNSFPLPRAGDRHVEEADYDGLVEDVRRATASAATLRALPESATLRRP